MIIADSNGNPTLVEYPLGDGAVIASGLTWEFYLLRHYAGDTTYSLNVFDDLVVYAVSVAEGKDVHHEHDHSETIAIDPACDTAGYVKHVCACGDVVIDGYVEPLGHLFGDWTVDEGPTCTHAGSRHAECSRCGQTVVESIPALGHAFVHHDGKAPTVGVEGWEDYVECSVCGFTTFKAISALGVEIVSIPSVGLGVLPSGSSFGDLGAPSLVDALCAGGSTISLAVSWDSSAFVSEPGSYRLPGTVSLPDDYYLSEGLSLMVYASYSISRDLSGIADIVFVIDTTGSMSDDISSVKSNVKAFADELYATGMSVRWALVEYEDITCDGLGSTKVVKDGADPWYSDVDAYKSAIGRLVLGYGGDAPETVIDGLEAARHLPFRDSAGRFFVVVTDAGYKADNQYGVPDMASEISNLVSDGILVFVVTSTGYYSEYRGLADSTGGKLLDINGDFSRGLMEIAERIGESSVASIRMATMPSVTEYLAGDVFDPTGMVIEAVYENGAVRTIGSYVVEPSGPLSVGDTHVIVRFAGFVLEIPVTVRDALAIMSIQSIDLGALPSGSSFDDLGAPSVVSATCADGSALSLEVAWDSSAFVSEPGSYRLHGTVSVPAGFRLADGVSSTIYASYSISSAMSGIVDVVFVIDTTASMSDEISGVKSSVKEFADSLYATGLSVRWALVEYQDITCDGLGSTRVVMNGADPWYADVDAYKSAIGGLVLGYGEDEPETVIDGLEAARHLSFRDSSGRIFVVVTDAGYKADNQYGVPDMASEISYLKSDGISVFVVTSAGCYADYRDLADSTGGKLLDIGGDFSDGLMEVAERIGESGIVSIRIVSLPDVTDYFVGEAFDPAGMVVEAVYGNGAVRQVSFYTVEPSGPLSAGVSHVTIHIGAVTADVPVTVRAATVSKGDVFAYNGLEYTVGSIRPGEVSVTGCSGSPSRVTIPSEVGYKGFSFSVVSVASKAFYGCATLVYLDLGAVQEVGFKAFANCSKLKTLVVSDTVKVFGSYAFYGCGIESLEIPGDGVVLEASAFSACKKMTSIAFSGAGAVIGTNAFYKNNGVSTVDLSTVASVGFKAFPYCYGLETLVIPGTLGSMGAYAFYRCDGLKTLVVEEGVESIPASAFSGCKSIETVSFPSTLKSVGANAFHGVKFIGADGKSLDPAAENLRGHVFAKSGTSLRMSSLLEGDEFCVG